MASHLFVGSGSSRSRSKGNASPSQLVCYHNEIAPLRIIRYDGPTKGKIFYGCSYWPIMDDHDITAESAAPTNPSSEDPLTSSAAAVEPVGDQNPPPTIQQKDLQLGLVMM
uniref:Zinc finger GRF-type domain-containing protein n=1 Tax=Chenopodium quinoa TaxID=63459 RepID=A0A803MJI9_CHEQI